MYGVRKVHAQLGRAGGVHARPVARCTVQRLMKAAGPAGHLPYERPADDAGRGRPGQPAGPREARLHRHRARPLVGGRPYVRTFADACRWTSGTNSTRASPLGSGHGRGSETLGTRPYT